MGKRLFPIGMIARTTISEFKFACESGFESVELSTNPGALEYFLDSLEELTLWRKYFPVPISAIGYFGVEYHRDPEERNKLLRLMDACKTLQTNILHIGSGSGAGSPKEDLNRTNQFFGEIITEAKQRDLTLALYTCKVSNFACDPEYWDEIFRNVPDLKLKYDPSHAYHSVGRKYLAEIQNYGDKIVHFHAKGGYLLAGNRHSEGDPRPGSGEDQIEWKAILMALMDCNYKGAISLELHSDRYSNNNEYYEALKESKKYLEEKVNEIQNNLISTENINIIEPIKIDDTKIQGIQDTIAYQDLRNKSIEEIYKVLKYKLVKK